VAHIIDMVLELGVLKSPSFGMLVEPILASELFSGELQLWSTFDP
jgi:hypothetical protein